MTPLDQNYYTRLHDLCDCPECTFSKNQREDKANNNIETKLNQLPKINARPDFDRKMAAAFAMELEEEVSRKNQSWLRKSKKITLPDLITNLTEEFN